MHAARQFHIAQATVALQFIEQSQINGVYFHAEIFNKAEFYAVF